MSGVKVETRYLATSGEEFNTRAEAEAENSYLELERAWQALAAPKYNPGYDGPMPYSPRSPDLRDVWRYRSQLKHLWLGVPPQEPQVQVVYRDRPVVKWRGVPAWVATATALLTFVAGTVMGGYVL